MAINTLNVVSQGLIPRADSLTIATLGWLFTPNVFLFNNFFLWNLPGDTRLWYLEHQNTSITLKETKTFIKVPKQKTLWFVQPKNDILVLNKSNTSITLKKTRTIISLSKQKTSWSEQPRKSIITLEKSNTSISIPRADRSWELSK